MFPLLRRSLAASLLALPLACSVSLGLNELEAGCPDGQKYCDGQCIGTDDPAHGCAAEGCGGCNLPHAKASCSAGGVCAVALCASGFRDCQDTLPGCETDTDSDVERCGDCDTDCTRSPPPNVLEPACGGGVCYALRCQRDSSDCNGLWEDGCEESRAELQTDARNCGRCGTACTGGQSCVAGQCQ